MSNIVGDDHNQLAGRIRQLLSVYQDNQDLLLIGAYKSGSNPELDEAIRQIDAINALLQQKVEVKATYDETVQQMRKLVL